MCMLDRPSRSLGFGGAGGRCKQRKDGRFPMDWWWSGKPMEMVSSTLPLAISNNFHRSHGSHLMDCFKGKITRTTHIYIYIFVGKSMVLCRFSLEPIQWIMVWQGGTSSRATYFRFVTFIVCIVSKRLIELREQMRSELPDCRARLDHHKSVLENLSPLMWNICH